MIDTSVAIYIQTITGFLYDVGVFMDVLKVTYVNVRKHRSFSVIWEKTTEFS